VLAAALAVPPGLVPVSFRDKPTAVCPDAAVTVKYYLTNCLPISMNMGTSRISALKMLNQAN
jgi:hypothetical protein